MLKINGIKKMAGESKCLEKMGLGWHMQVMFDKHTHNVFLSDLLSTESYVVYHDENIVNCGSIYGKATMKELREIIEEGICYQNHCDYMAGLYS